MPIKRENAKRYPANWQEIRAAVLDRSGNRCEGSPKFPDCRVLNGSYRDKTRVVLTIGHLDHTPENCDMENLKAWCQRCHLNYDAKYHAQNAYSTRRHGKAIADLFSK